MLAYAKQSKYPDDEYRTGLLNYAVNKEAGIFKYVIGLPHDGTKGIEMVRHAALKSGGPFADDIWFVVLKIDIEEKEFLEAQLVWNRLNEKYPRNELICEFRSKYLAKK